MADPNPPPRIRARTGPAGNREMSPALAAGSAGRAASPQERERMTGVSRGRPWESPRRRREPTFGAPRGPAGDSPGSPPPPPARVPAARLRPGPSSALPPRLPSSGESSAPLLSLLSEGTFFPRVASGPLPGDRRALSREPFSAVPASLLAPGPSAPRVLAPCRFPCPSGPRQWRRTAHAFAKPQMKPNPNIHFLIKPETKAVFPQSWQRGCATVSSLSTWRRQGNPTPTASPTHTRLELTGPATTTAPERPPWATPPDDPAGQDQSCKPEGTRRTAARTARWQVFRTSPTCGRGAQARHRRPQGWLLDEGPLTPDLIKHLS
ncbi:vegetative cell wall protein gp1-like [Sapajus apella]|uniref:Vegetative cell wall protein gp1-like n=1 Tax=Sapajus apella TaxID=9515 RepID=A0A6J3H2S3_SAPAP|nr:vegetative cell wall protein gp1-like [Sapajus apella]